MKKTNNRELAALLQGLDKNEIRQLYKRATTLRKGTPGYSRSRHIEDGDEDDAPVIRHRKQQSLDDVVLQLLRAQAPETSGKTLRTRTGLVVHVARRLCTVSIDSVEQTCLLSPEIAQTQQTSIAVGDEVVVVTRAGAEEDIVERVLPRRTFLSRPDPDKRPIDRTVVANVDAVVVVVSVKTPPLHPRLIDRYLIAIERGGAQAILAVNKLDLTTAEERQEELAKLEPYAAIGLPILHVSAGSGEGIPELKQALEGKLCVFVGHSGVGKSSLLNALRTDLQLQANEVSAGYGRGTHTTTASTLYDIGEGTRIIDTPGIRSFGLANLSADELQWYFPEFEEHAHRCKFRDCTHSHEPKCRVREAVEGGQVSKHRYETYRRLLQGM